MHHNLKQKLARSEVFTAVRKMMFFRVLAPCTLVGRRQSFYATLKPRTEYSQKLDNT